MCRARRLDVGMCCSANRGRLIKRASASVERPDALAWPTCKTYAGNTARMTRQMWTTDCMVLQRRTDPALIRYTHPRRFPLRMQLPARTTFARSLQPTPGACILEVPTQTHLTKAYRPTAPTPHSPPPLPKLARICLSPDNALSRNPLTHPHNPSAYPLAGAALAHALARARQAAKTVHPPTPTPVAYAGCNVQVPVLPHAHDLRDPSSPARPRCMHDRLYNPPPVPPPACIPGMRKRKSAYCAAPFSRAPAGRRRSPRPASKSRTRCPRPGTPGAGSRGTSTSRRPPPEAPGRRRRRRRCLGPPRRPRTGPNARHTGPPPQHPGPRPPRLRWRGCVYRTSGQLALWFVVGPSVRASWRASNCCTARRNRKDLHLL